jgi:hypothetical protein
MHRFRLIAIVGAMGCAPEIVAASYPRAAVGCTGGCLAGVAWPVGGEPSVSSSWEGKCMEDNPRIGAGPRDVVTCNEVPHRTVVTCGDGCVARGNTVTPTRPGMHTIHVELVPTDGRARTVDVSLRAEVVTDAAVRCVALTTGAVQLDVSLRSTGNEPLAGPLPVVTLAGEACRHREYGEDADVYTCAAPPDAKRFEVAIAAGAFATKKTISCPF